MIRVWAFVQRLLWAALAGLIASMTACGLFDAPAWGGFLVSLIVIEFCLSHPSEPRP